MGRDRQHPVLQRQTPRPASGDRICSIAPQRGQQLAEAAQAQPSERDYPGRLTASRSVLRNDEAPGRPDLDQDHPCLPGASRAGLPSSIDLSSRTLRFLTGQLAAWRQEIGTRWRRLPAGRQALLALAHLWCGDTYTRLAAGFGIGIGIATVDRYIRETVEALAALTPSLA